MPKKPSAAITVAVFVVGVCAFLQVYSIQAILPVLQEALGANAQQIGLAVSATIAAIALVSPFMGMISDRFGRKGFILGSMLFLALPTCMLGFASDIRHFYAWRFLQGLCIPAMTVVILAYIGEEFSKNVAKLSAVYVAGTVLGGFLGRFLLGYLHTWIGYRLGFVAMGALTFGGAIAVRFLLPPSSRFVASGNLKNSLSLLVSHSKNKAVIASCLLGGCVLFSLVACFSFINLHLAKPPYRLGSNALANVFAVYLLGVAITPLSSKIIARFGAHRALIGAFLFCASGLLLTLATPLWAIVLGLAIMSTGVFVTHAATIGFMSGHLKQGRSLGMGLYYMCYYAGGSAGAWLGGVAFGLGDPSDRGWLYVALLVLFAQSLGVFIARSLKKV